MLDIEDGPTDTKTEIVESPSDAIVKAVKDAVDEAIDTVKKVESLDTVKVEDKDPALDTKMLMICNG